MEFAPANLGNGELTTSDTVVYTVPVGSSAMIRSIILINKSGSNVQVWATVNFGSGERNVIPPGLLLRPSFKYDDNSVVNILPGTTVTMRASSNGAVDYIINGVIAQ